MSSTSQQYEQEQQSKKSNQSKKQDTSGECIELKNIEYQSMLMNKNTSNKSELRPTHNPGYSLTDVNKILDNEKKQSVKLPWSRLTKSKKLNKIYDYVDGLKTKHDLIDKDIKEIKQYMKKCFERKMLQTAKVVQYDKNNENITDIPALIINEKNTTLENSGGNTKRFTLKMGDNKSSTLKNLSKGKSGSRSELVKNMKNKRKNKIDQINV